MDLRSLHIYVDSGQVKTLPFRNCPSSCPRLFVRIPYGYEFSIKITYEYCKIHLICFSYHHSSCGVVAIENV